MKKYLLSTLLFLLCCLFLSGCSRSENRNIPSDFQEPPAFNDPSGGLERNSSVTMEDISTIPDVNAEELFSDRDLDNDPDQEDALLLTAVDNIHYTISSSGTYILSGQAKNYTLIIEAAKEDKIQIILENVIVENENFPVIYVKSADKCFITSTGDNQLSVTGQFTDDGDIHTDAVIFSKDDLSMNGSGMLSIVSAAGNGITCKDDLVIAGGIYTIYAALDGIEASDSLSISDGSFNIDTAKDAIHCENDDPSGSIYIQGGTFILQAKDDGIQATSTLVIDGGDYVITSAEGLEATYVQINDGTFHINASDDGINAAEKCSDLDIVIEINGGTITIVMGPGDTDGLDANGTIIVNGGTIDVSCNSPFDADRGAIYNDGTIIINGEVVNDIPTSTMGGPRGGMGNDFGGTPPQGGYGNNGPQGGKGGRH